MAEPFPHSCINDCPRKSSRSGLCMWSIAEDEIRGRADSCKRAEQRSLKLSTNTGEDRGGNRANVSLQALSIHGQSNLCPLSNFKLKTKAAFSTE